MEGHDDWHAHQPCAENRGDRLQVRLVGMDNVNPTPLAQQESKRPNRQRKITTVREPCDPDLFDVRP